MVGKTLVNDVIDISGWEEGIARKHERGVAGGVLEGAMEVCHGAVSIRVARRRIRDDGDAAMWVSSGPCRILWKMEGIRNEGYCGDGGVRQRVDPVRQNRLAG